MTEINNVSRLKETRRELRNNCTDSEKYFWEYLRGSKFLGLKFRRQHSIERYILDFYCPKLKIGIELDGKVHEGREEYDNIRTEFLESYGITIIRYTNDEILNNTKSTLTNLENKLIPLLTKEGLGEV